VGPSSSLGWRAGRVEAALRRRVRSTRAAPPAATNADAAATADATASDTSAPSASAPAAAAAKQSPAPHGSPLRAATAGGAAALELTDGRGTLARGAPADLVTVTLYIVDMDDYLAHAREIGAVWRRLAGTDYPAMAGIGVSRLWDVEALVEIQGVAAVE